MSLAAAKEKGIKQLTFSSVHFHNAWSARMNCDRTICAGRQNKNDNKMPDLWSVSRVVVTVKWTNNKFTFPCALWQNRPESLQVFQKTKVCCHSWRKNWDSLKRHFFSRFVLPARDDYDNLILTQSKSEMRTNYSELCCYLKANLSGCDSHLPLNKIQRYCLSCY